MSISLITNYLRQIELKGDDVRAQRAFLVAQLVAYQIKLTENVKTEIFREALGRDVRKLLSGINEEIHIDVKLSFELVFQIVEVRRTLIYEPTSLDALSFVASSNALRDNLPGQIYDAVSQASTNGRNMRLTNEVSSALSLKLDANTDGDDENAE